MVNEPVRGGRNTDTASSGMFSRFNVKAIKYDLNCLNNQADKSQNKPMYFEITNKMSCRICAPSLTLALLLKQMSPNIKKTHFFYKSLS